MERGRHEAEDRLRARGERDRDGQHVVDEKGAPRHKPGAGSQQLRGDHVAASSRGEPLDDARIARGDHRHRDRGQERERNREEGVLVKRSERRFRPVRARREPVGAQADPRQERGERDLVKQLRVGERARGPDDGRERPSQESDGGGLELLRRRRIRRRLGDVAGCRLVLCEFCHGSAQLYTRDTPSANGTAPAGRPHRGGVSTQTALRRP